MTISKGNDEIKNHSRAFNAGADRVRILLLLKEIRRRYSRRISARIRGRGGLLFLRSRDMDGRYKDYRFRRVCLRVRSRIDIRNDVVAFTDSTLEEWWNTFLPDFEKVYSDFSLISDENILINSVAAKKMTFTGAIGGTSYKFIQASAIKGSLVYVITYTSTADRFDEHTEEMQSVLEYFEFK